MPEYDHYRSIRSSSKQPNKENNRDKEKQKQELKEFPTRFLLAGYNTRPNTSIGPGSITNREIHFLDKYRPLLASLSNYVERDDTDNARYVKYHQRYRQSKSARPSTVPINPEKLYIPKKPRVYSARMPKPEARREEEVKVRASTPRPHKSSPPAESQSCSDDCIQVYGYNEPPSKGEYRSPTNQAQARPVSFTSPFRTSLITEGMVPSFQPVKPVKPSSTRPPLELVSHRDVSEVVDPQVHIHQVQDIMKNLFDMRIKRRSSTIHSTTSGEYGWIPPSKILHSKDNSNSESNVYCDVIPKAKYEWRSPVMYRPLSQTDITRVLFR
eukprot:Tbor_TRINITY_DN5463_c1_g4::TRINITY_DN5463_c1_g4_i1::g.25055::m.25055